MSIDTAIPSDKRGKEHSFFKRLLQRDILEAAWQKVRANNGSAGGDGVTVVAFGRAQPLKLDYLALNVSSGVYHPGPHRFIDIPKKAGGVRRLSIPCIGDRVLQTAAANLLLPVLEPEFEQDSYGYRPGRSVKQAIDRVGVLRRQGYVWVVDGDIECFFDNVPHDKLLKELDTYIDDQRFIELIALWLSSFAEETGWIKRGLAQGNPLSPMLANLYLDQLDEEFLGKDMRMVRFADDFLILAKSRKKAEAGLTRLKGLMKQYGLRLNLSKTRIVHFDQGFHFLGHLLIRSLSIKSEATAPMPEVPKITLVPIVEAEYEDNMQDRKERDCKTDQKIRADIIRPLYILEPGRRLTIRNKSFSVTEDGHEILALPPAAMHRIDVGPQVFVSDDAIRLAVANDIPVYFLNSHGGIEGQLSAPIHNRFDLHLQQTEHIHDEGKRLELAKIITLGRTHNQRALLRRLNRRRKIEAVSSAAEKISRNRLKIPGAATIEQVMGHEGENAKIFWPAWGKCLEHGFLFRHRRRGRATNAANVLLNWFSWLLARDIQVLVSRAGLHPGFASLHTTRNGHMALVYDLMEEFRAPLAEGLVIYVINNRIVGADDFSRWPGEGVMLNASIRPRLIRAWEEWVDRQIKSPFSKKKTSWRMLIVEQIDAYKRHIMLEKKYSPYYMDY